MALVAGVVMLVAFETLPWFHNQVLESVSRRPTPFTELYFSDPARLPRHLVMRQPERFRFVIVNHEGRDVDYQVQVIVHGPRGDEPLATDTVHIISGRSTEQAAQFFPDLPGAEYVFTVLLVGRPERIHFSATS